jgi:hypothetical protein
MKANSEFSAASQLLHKMLKELAAAGDYEQRSDDVPLLKLNK